MAEKTDVIVIGSGQGGVPFAVASAKAGKRVVLFERGALGGSCINFGCTPSKALLAAAHNAGRARLAAGLGVHAEVRVDQRAVFERVRRIRSEWSAGVGARLSAAGVELVRASASFSGERTVRGGEREWQAPLVVVDTGTSAAVPPLDGIERVPFLTNATFFDQRELPPRLLVLGGGYIGLELGQGAQRLGCAVTVVHRGARIMDREEADAAAAVHAGLERDGVSFRLGAHPAAVAYRDGTVRLTLSSGETLEGEALLIAVGRTPNTAELALGRTGIACDARGYVEVDEHLQTACPGVYAIGDVAGQPAFTHVSWEDYRRLESTLGGWPRTRDDRVLSYSTFTEPQLARTGLTKAEARAKGIDAASVTLPLSHVARAVEWDLELGFYRLVVDRATDRIAGATFVGYEAGELIQVVGALIEQGATWRDLDRFVGIHPTFGEGLPSLARLFEA
ncbi:MAG: FAD-dependent oxidoreductase [Candidatus Baltobacteraceae bacterium]|jgi:dihydrolipoamide dehydrogenase